jgi:hypothetical protein
VSQLLQPFELAFGDHALMTVEARTNTVLMVAVLRRHQSHDFEFAERRTCRTLLPDDVDRLTDFELVGLCHRKDSTPRGRVGIALFNRLTLRHIPTI